MKAILIEEDTIFPYCLENHRGLKKIIPSGFITFHIHLKGVLYCAVSPLNRAHFISRLTGNFQEAFHV